MLTSLTLALTFTAAAQAPVVAFLPPHGSTPELDRLGLLIEARAAELLTTAHRTTDLHVKQALAMADQEGLDRASLSQDEVADRARVLLGADRVIAVRLAPGSGGVQLDGSIRSAAAPVPFSVALPGSWAKALKLGSETLAAAVLAQDGATLPAGASAQPESSSDAALKALGVCWEVALNQSLSAEAPVTIAPKELASATTACKSAVKADGGLRFAAAVHALLLAIGRSDVEADKALAKAGSEGALEPRTLARAYLASRNQPTDARVKLFQAEVDAHPSALMLRAYLAETLASANEHAKAVEVWKGYLALAPGSPFAQGRLSRSLARLGQTGAALDAARAALALAPDSNDARLQLGSRQIDAQQYAEAVKTLVPLTERPSAPAEGILRLGWAYWLQDDVDSAEPLFKLAAERASGPMAWRTKGRALYDLALVALKAGHADEARAIYRRSLETGYAVRPADPALAGSDAKAAPAPTKVSPAGAVTAKVVVDDKGANLTPEQLAAALTLARDSATRKGATLAPDGETKAAALQALQAQKRRGFEVDLTLTPTKDGGLKADALVLTYPERAFRGAWGMGGSGAGVKELLEAIIPALMNDVAADLDW